MYEATKIKQKYKLKKRQYWVLEIQHFKQQLTPGKLQVKNWKERSQKREKKKMMKMHGW
jgi:hypothetical protein